LKTVAVNDFVRRQVKGSGKTYSPNLNFEEVAEYAADRFEDGYFRQGYRDGVVIVEAAEDMNEHFVCPFVEIDETTKLRAGWISRQEGEKPYIQIRAINGTPLPVGKVEFILYRHDVLAENDEQSTEAEWELISVHALPEGVADLPMGPVTMMRNQLEFTGGTKACYSSKEWAEAVRFWQKYAALEPEEY
tara:strand:+ start:145 stop:714 length:570 start_codon:yes stop_codon:yes gene_type:complete